MPAALLAAFTGAGCGFFGGGSGSPPPPATSTPAPTPTGAPPTGSPPATPTGTPQPTAPTDLPCRADCVGRACGDDRCGGSCGTCPPDRDCRGGVCAERPPACTGETCGDPWRSTCTADASGYRLCVPDARIADCAHPSLRIACGEDRTCEPGRLGCRGAPTTARVVLVIDRSSSMAGARWDAVRAGLAAFFTRYGPLHEVGLRTFPTSGCAPGAVTLPRRDAGAELQAHIEDEGPSPSGQTPLSAALEGLADVFGDPAEGQAVVLITDGGESCAVNLDGALAAVAALRARGVGVHAVGLGTQVDGEGLAAISRAGGTDVGLARGFHPATDAAGLAGALADVMRRLDARTCSGTGRVCTGDLAGDCAGGRLERAAVCPVLCEPGRGCIECHEGEARCAPGPRAELCDAAGRWTLVPDAAEVEPNGLFETANGPLCGDMTMSGEMAAANDWDYFHVAVLAPGTLRLSVWGDGGACNWVRYATKLLRDGGEAASADSDCSIELAVDPRSEWHVLVQPTRINNRYQTGPYAFALEAP